MIIDASGYEAVFKTESEGKVTFHVKPLVLWHDDDAGQMPVGLFLSGKCGVLAYATGANNFVRYQERQERQPSSIPAEPGWWAVRKEEHGDEVYGFWEPILAWMITENGWHIEAICPPDASGEAEPVETGENTVVFVRGEREHPGHGPWPTWSEAKQCFEWEGEEQCLRIKN